MLTSEIEAQMASAIDELLGRGHYDRRESVPAWVTIEGKCAKCGSHQSQRFSRNGGRQRTLLTMWGEIAP